MKKLLMVGLAFIVLLAIIMPVSAWVNVPRYENKIVPTEKDIGDGMGALYISDLCHCGIFSSTMNLWRVSDTTPVGYSSGALIEKENFDLYDTNRTPDAIISLDLSGKFDDRYAPGVYAVELLDGNGGQPEYAVVAVFLNGQSEIRFTGHAISGGGDVCQPVYTIISATYGYGHCTEITLHHGNYNRVETLVVDHHGDYNTNHQYVGNNNGDYTRTGYPGHYVYHYVAPTSHTVYTFQNVGQGNGDWILKPHHSGHDANDYQYIAPSQACQTDGTIIDVMTAVQDAVNQGYTQFQFNNSQNPGGIFDSSATHLISQIADPSSGYLKTFSITYSNGCGSTRIVTGQEYQIIDLKAGTPVSEL